MTKLESDSEANAKTKTFSEMTNMTESETGTREAEGCLMFVIPSLTIFSLELHCGTF